MGEKIIEPIKHECLKCGYVWYSNLLNPKVCARCKNYNYKKCKGVK